MALGFMELFLARAAVLAAPQKISGETVGPGHGNFAVGRATCGGAWPCRALLQDFEPGNRLQFQADA
jgi:hypothetical protein